MSLERVGPYEVVKTLGQGGMGVVYEVRDPHDPSRRLALKLILGEKPPADMLVRFQREAELLAKVSHPNIVGVRDFSHDQGRPYMVFDYVGGQNLRELCQGAPMEPRQVAELGRDLAGALDQLHRRGIIHRDLKPENVMLTPDGLPVLLDFGLARELDGERLTATGTVLGTPSYMAPEQAEGAKDLDARTDVYGLGAILFYLLLGRPPFRGSSPMAVLKQVLLNEPDWSEDPLKATDVTSTPPPSLPQIMNEEQTLLTGAGPASSPDATSWDQASPPGPSSADAEVTMATGFAVPSGPNLAVPPGSGYGSTPGGSNPGPSFGSGPGGFGSRAGAPGLSAGAPAGGFGSAPVAASSGLSAGADPGSFGSAPSAGPAAFTPPTRPPVTSTVIVAGPEPTGPGVSSAYDSDARAAAEATSRVIYANSRVPRELEAIVRVAMAKGRGDRYVSTAALRDDLDRFLQGAGGAAAQRQLRAMGWRKRRKTWVLALALALIGLGVAETFRRSRLEEPPPVATPQPTPEVNASLTSALAGLPPLGASGFSERYKRLAAAFPRAELVRRLGQARHDLDALRALAPSPARETAIAAFRAEHGSLGLRALGPVELEFGPRWRLTHEAPDPKDLREFTEGKRKRRRAYLGRLGAHVSFVDAAGTQALVANGKLLTYWNLASAEPRSTPPQEIDRASGTALRWSGTLGIAKGVGLHFLYGTAQAGDTEMAGLVVSDRSSLHDLVGIPGGGVQGGLNSKTDRIGAGAVSPSGAWLAGGTDGSEILLAPAQRNYSDGALTRPGSFGIQLHDEKGTDVQGLAFLSEDRLVSLSGDHSERDFSLRLWQLDLRARAFKALARRALPNQDNAEAPCLLVGLDGTRVLVGRAERGRVLLVRAEGENLTLGPELTDLGEPAFARSPICGVAGQVGGRGVALLGSGLCTDERKFPNSAAPGSLAAWCGDELVLGSRYRLQAEFDGFCSVDVSADGRRVIAGTQLGEVLVWELEPAPK